MKKPAGSACEQCPGRNRPCVLPERATGRARLVVVGEAPGQNEVREGRPFIGASGRAMERDLKKFCGMQRSDVHWTNAILCDVPMDDQAAARKCCATRLRAELVDAGAETVLAVGGLALQSACGWSRKPSILRYRGSVITADDPLRSAANERYTVLPTVHPAFVMRAPQWAPIFQADLARAGRVARNGFARPEDMPNARIKVAKSLDAVRRYLSLLDTSVSIDIETTGLDVHVVDMTCLVLADTTLAVVIPWSKTQGGDGLFFNGQHTAVVAEINSCLRTRIAVTHNGPAYDHIGLARFGIELGDWDDSLLAYHAITSHFPKRLGHVVSCYVDAPPWKEWPHDVSLEELWAYNGRDGLYTAQAWAALRGSMDEDDMRVYESDKRSAELCTEMSVTGFAFDQERAALISNELRAVELTLAGEAAALARMPDINLLSPKQLAKAVFGQLGGRVVFRTATGAASLGVDAMRAYAAGGNEELAEFALAVLAYRRVRKCRATYVDGVRPHEDGRVRPTWLSYGTISGRWSAQRPNLANLPRPENDPSTQWGGIRSLYTASPGRQLVAFDIGQAEFRIAAYLSGDPNMIAACQPGQDVHAMNAAAIFGEAFARAQGDERKTLRTLAKTSGFAVCYLAEAVTVHARLVASGVNVTLSQVEGMLQRLKRAFAGYYEYQGDQLLRTIKTGVVRSPILGRPRWVGHAPKPPEVANFPIQSGAADVMNTKLYEISRRARELPNAKLVAMVYDAAYFDVADSQVDRMSDICREVFEAPVTIGGRSFVLPIDLHVGARWSEL